MDTLTAPIARQSLSDELAQRVRQLIQEGAYAAGDRLPSIAKMARDFGVAHPTLREALRKLETVGLVTIRHGSGVYVASEETPLLIPNPIYESAVDRKLLLDLVEARISIEVKTAALAARHATPEQLAELRALMDEAEAGLGDSGTLGEANLRFHRLIALASGNQVLNQLLEVLGGKIHEEQRVILDSLDSRRRFQGEHLAILEALEERDAEMAAARMQAHLEGVQDLLLLLRIDSPEDDY